MPVEGKLIRRSLETQVLSVAALLSTAMKRLTQLWPSPQALAQEYREAVKHAGTFIL